MNPVVGLAMPMRNSGIDPEAVARGIALKATEGAYDITPGQAWTSLLPYTFNLLWTGFLGMRETHRIKYFAMIHDDVRPASNWLDTMINELETTGADIVSAVIPIKDARGLTSTAVDDTGDEWNPRRLTLSEVFELPATFGDREAGGPVLLNTGLWVCRFDKAWCEKVAFRQQDRITWFGNGDGGRYVPETKPEDWDFSRQVRALGGKLMATRKVPLVHERQEWHTNHPWGKWTRDEDLAAERRVHGIVARQAGR